MFNNSIDKVWTNIRKYEGETFFTISGVAYRYTVKDSCVIINDDKRRTLNKSYFEKALLIKNPTPAKLNQEGVWGPSYIYGIITDKRIK